MSDILTKITAGGLRPRSLVNLLRDDGTVVGQKMTSADGCVSFDIPPTEGAQHHLDYAVPDGPFSVRFE